MAMRTLDSFVEALTLALVRLVLERHHDPEQVVAALERYLVARHRRKDLRRVRTRVTSLLRALARKQLVILEVARQEDVSLAKEAIRPFLVTHHASDAAVEVRITPTLVGGWRVRIGSREVDHSTLRTLQLLHQALLRAALTSVHDEGPSTGGRN